MKIRTGFVSNSSSSSFVVLIPKDFDVEAFLKSRENDIPDIVYDHTGGPDLPDGALKESFDELMDDEMVWGEMAGVLSDLLEGYVIAELDTGPDDERIILADWKKAEKIVRGKLGKE
jgi:hypothetical protein